MEICENEPLSRHTTFRTGGPARYFIFARTEAEVREASDFARRQGLPLFVLGGGSNVLAADAGFPGVVLRLATAGIQMQPLDSDRIRMVAEAGEEWDALVARAVTESCAGFENMSLIPGSLGGAVAGNIGAYGAEIKDTLAWAEAMDLRNGTVRRFASAECRFAYRHSFFKTVEGRNFVVLRAAFDLRRNGPLNLGYHDLQACFPGRVPTLAEVRQAVIAIRQRKLPDPAQVGTAGSFFKNLLVTPEDFAALRARYPGLPGHPEGSDRVKVPLGYVLDKICGLKGCQQGRSGTHAQQALVLVNHGGTAAEVAALAWAISEQVFDRTGLRIEWEVEKLGFIE
jgi:UDP-N-acetylmuramate dehydrogenase